MHGAAPDVVQIPMEITTPPPPAKVLWTNPTAVPPQSAEWGRPLEIFSTADHLLGTRLRCTIDEANNHHAMYLARTQLAGDTSTRGILVKFTAKYNEGAHRLLANHDPPLAPALYSCTRTIGELFMVVMEYISESEGGYLHNILLRPNCARTFPRLSVYFMIVTSFLVTSGREPTTYTCRMAGVVSCSLILIALVGTG